jgi:hypothetical protein
VKGLGLVLFLAGLSRTLNERRRTLTASMNFACMSPNGSTEPSLVKTNNPLFGGLMNCNQVSELLG